MRGGLPRRDPCCGGRRCSRRGKPHGDTRQGCGLKSFSAAPPLPAAPGLLGMPPRLWPGPTQSDAQMLSAELEPPPRPRKRERLGLLTGLPGGGVPGWPSLSSTKGPFFTDVLCLNRPQRKSTHSCFLCRRRRRGKYLAKGVRVRWWVGQPKKTLVGRGPAVRGGWDCALTPCPGRCIGIQRFPPKDRPLPVCRAPAVK